MQRPNRCSLKILYANSASISTYFHNAPLDALSIATEDATVCSTCVTCFFNLCNRFFGKPLPKWWSSLRCRVARLVPMRGKPRTLPKPTPSETSSQAQLATAGHSWPQPATAGHSRPPRVFQVSSKKDQKSLRRPLRLCKIREFLLSKEWN